MFRGPASTVNCADCSIPVKTVQRPPTAAALSTTGTYRYTLHCNTHSFQVMLIMARRIKMRKSNYTFPSFIYSSLPEFLNYMSVLTLSKGNVYCTHMYNMCVCTFALMIAYMLHCTAGVVHSHCGLVETFYTPPVAGLSNVVIEIVHVMLFSLSFFLCSSDMGDYIFLHFFL